jgi:hypothetical protein
MNPPKRIRLSNKPGASTATKEFILWVCEILDNEKNLPPVLSLEMSFAKGSIRYDVHVGRFWDFLENKHLENVQYCQELQEKAHLEEYIQEAKLASLQFLREEDREQTHIKSILNKNTLVEDFKNEF